MQTVDLVIGGMGVLAIVATSLGVVFYEEAAGERTVIFPERVLHTHDSEEFSGVSAGTHTYESDLRPNATFFRDIVVTITASADRAAGESGGSYEVRVIPPTGSPCTKPGSWAQNQEISINECRWAQPPEPVETTDPDGVDETTTWSQPLTIEVIITDPTHPVPALATDFTYDINIEYEMMGYAATIQQPDISSR